jgi:hypothetical protein
MISVVGPVTLEIPEPAHWAMFGVTSVMTCSAPAGANSPLVIKPVLTTTTWPSTSLGITLYLNVLGSAAGLPHTNVRFADPESRSTRQEAVIVNVSE